MFECDENDTTLAPLTSYSKEQVVDDHLTYGHRKCGYSNLAMSFEDFDIVGDSNEHRFPWQKDISIQCCLGDNLITNGMGYFPAWNSYLPRDRTSSLTRDEIPSHPNMFRPKSTGCLTTTLCKEDLQKLHLKHASNLTSPPNREKTNLLGRYMEAISGQGPAQLDESEGYILPSPRISPITIPDRPEFVFDSDSDPHQDQLTESRFSPTKKSASNDGMYNSDDKEPSPSNVRRGRRAAIIDTKNIGDVSPTNMSPVSSPCSSDDETDRSSDVTDRLGSHGSFDVGTVPSEFLLSDPNNRLVKRNTIADFSTPPKAEDHRKGRSSFSLIKKMRARSKDSLHQLEDLLRKMKPSEFKDNHLSIYKSLHWTDLIASSDKSPTHIDLPEKERKRREAVWELFKAECTYLIDHLMVLKHCFMEPLKKVQVEGYLMFAEPQDLLGNLDELCYFTTHSRDGGIYHTYCLNYVNALPYLHLLRKNEEFVEFEKWCCHDPRCNRLQLTDLMVAPLQHCTKLPLLLENVKKYTSDETERDALSELVVKVNTSLQKMEDKMKWAKNFERLQEIQKQLIWPPVSDLAPKAMIPEFLRSSLLHQPCENFLATQDRQLLFEGYVVLHENAKGFDIYLFLFNDVLLLTKPKKIHRKKHSLDSSAMTVQTTSSSEKQTYTVYRQPIAVDRLCLYDVSHSDASVNGLKNAFVLVQYNRYHQIIDVLTIQCALRAVKNSLMEKIHEATGNQRNASGLTSRTNSISEVST
ncbi:pleckstrin homology domain-containing family G member 7-like isoform X2 [Ostrea edulis]|uniref:pleckstrin homology domain-containing family G member 7-like isoform X2 n=1 Tax=Ostrea edulis TaxID=37623 RepID=UPI0024AFC237|nr:pleckstrin homology domain-containing family G member 7-like isoform X2 [Ostrea edulis]